MATVLRFLHHGWDMVTASWTAGSSDPCRTSVCYGWDASDGFWKIQFDIPFEVLLDRIARGGIVDLGPASRRGRGHPRPAIRSPRRRLPQQM